MMTETTTANRLERETCSRCGGSGTYSYCQSYGTRCFKCAGRKEVLTKRGRAASDYLEALRSVPTSELAVGTVLRADSITEGGDLFEAWFKVEMIEVTTDENCGSWRVVDGERVPTPPGLVNIHLTDGKGGGMMLCSVEAGRTFRVAQTA